MPIQFIENLRYFETRCLPIKNMVYLGFLFRKIDYILQYNEYFLKEKSPLFVTKEWYESKEHEFFYKDGTQVTNEKEILRCNNFIKEMFYTSYNEKLHSLKCFIQNIKNDELIQLLKKERYFLLLIKNKLNDTFCIDNSEHKYSPLPIDYDIEMNDLSNNNIEEEKDLFLPQVNSDNKIFKDIHNEEIVSKWLEDWNMDYMNSIKLSLKYIISKNKIIFKQSVLRE